MPSDLPKNLREVALRALDLNDRKGGRDLGRLAKRKGLTLSYTTFDKIVAGTYKSRPQNQTLDALAALAALPRRDVYAVAGVPLPLAPFAKELPPDVDLLDARDRKVVLGLISHLVDIQRRRHAESAPAPGQ